MSLKRVQTASGASNLLHCADNGAPYTIEAWTFAGVVPAQAAFTFYPTVFINCPGVTNPNPWQNYFINDAKGIIPISWSQSATSASNVLLGNSTSYFWGFYNGYNTGLPPAGSFDNRGLNAMAKLFPYISISNANYLPQIAYLYNQVAFNSTDFVPVRSAETIFFTNSANEAFSGIIQSSSQISVNSGVTNFGNTFVYAKLS